MHGHTMVVRQLSLFNEAGAGGNPAVSSATTTVQQDWAYQITKLFWKFPKKRRSWIIRIKKVKVLAQTERLRDRTSKISQENNVPSLRQLQQETTNAGLRQEDISYLEEIIATKIEQLDPAKWGAHFADPIAKDERESDQSDEMYLQKINNLVMNGEIISYIDRIYKTWERWEWDMLIEFLEELLWQSDNDEMWDIDNTIEEIAIKDAIKYREKRNRDSSLLEEQANLLEEEEEVLLNARKNPNTSWYPYTKDELQKLCFNHKAPIDKLTTLDATNKKRLYRSYITLNNTIYWIERRNDGQWENKLRGYLSVLDRKPSAIFIPVDFSIPAREELVA